jgi:hypothetical protein
MPHRYVVGFSISNRYRHVQVEAEDALDAAQQVKSVYPDAHITYSRRHNKRADDRHPEPSLYETQPIRAAKTRRSVKAPRRRAR